MRSATLFTFCLITFSTAFQCEATEAADMMVTKLPTSVLALSQQNQPVNITRSKTRISTTPDRMDHVNGTEIKKRKYNVSRQINTKRNSPKPGSMYKTKPPKRETSMKLPFKELVHQLNTTRMTTNTTVACTATATAVVRTPTDAGQTEKQAELPVDTGTNSPARNESPGGCQGVNVRLKSSCVQINKTPQYEQLTPLPKVFEHLYFVIERELTCKQLVAQFNTTTTSTSTVAARTEAAGQTKKQAELLVDTTSSPTSTESADFRQFVTFSAMSLLALVGLAISSLFGGVYVFQRHRELNRSPKFRDKCVHTAGLRASPTASIV